MSGLACDSVSLTALCVPVESNELRPHVRPTRAGTLGDRRAPRPLPRGAGPGCRLESPVALLPTDQGPSGVSPLPTPPPGAEKAGEAAGGTGKTLDSHQHLLSSLLVFLTFFLLFMLFFFYTLVVIYLTIYFSFW